MEDATPFLIEGGLSAASDCPLPPHFQPAVEQPQFAEASACHHSAAY